MAGPVTWSRYRESIGDRSDLFADLGDRWSIERALYPGSYVDLAPSTSIRSVTYVDTDARAAGFFADPDLVGSELAGRTRPGAGEHVRFLAADYTRPLESVRQASMDLLISLYAGPVWAAKGKERWRVTADAGTDPATGKRLQVKRSFTSRTDAEAFLRELDAAATITFIAREGQTFRQVSDAWPDSKRAAVRPKTVYASAVARPPRVASSVE